MKASAGAEKGRSVCADGDHVGLIEGRIYPRTMMKCTPVSVFLHTLAEGDIHSMYV